MSDTRLLKAWRPFLVTATKWLPAEIAKAGAGFGRDPDTIDTGAKRFDGTAGVLIGVEMHAGDPALTVGGELHGDEHIEDRLVKAVLDGDGVEKLRPAEGPDAGAIGKMEQRDDAVRVGDDGRELKRRCGNGKRSDGGTSACLYAGGVVGREEAVIDTVAGNIFFDAVRVKKIEAGAAVGRMPVFGAPADDTGHLVIVNGDAGRCPLRINDGAAIGCGPDDDVGVAIEDGLKMDGVRTNRHAVEVPDAGGGTGDVGGSVILRCADGGVRVPTEAGDLEFVDDGVANGRTEIEGELAEEGTEGGLKFFGGEGEIVVAAVVALEASVTGRGGADGVAGLVEVWVHGGQKSEDRLQNSDVRS